ncbi:hypothetical protein RFI_25307, partial [Reticulomyxa filosa]
FFLFCLIFVASYNKIEHAQESDMLGQFYSQLSKRSTQLAPELLVMGKKLVGGSMLSLQDVDVQVESKPSETLTSLPEENSSILFFYHLKKKKKIELIKECFVCLYLFWTAEGSFFTNIFYRKKGKATRALQGAVRINSDLSTEETKEKEPESDKKESDNREWRSESQSTFNKQHHQRISILMDQRQSKLIYKKNGNNNKIMNFQTSGDSTLETRKLTPHVSYGNLKKDGSKRKVLRRDKSEHNTINAQGENFDVNKFTVEVSNAFF